MSKIFRTVLKIFGVLLALLFIVLVLCTVIGVTIDLSFLKPGVETSARLALGRDVKIDGPVVFEFSTWPAIEVKDVRIANVPKSPQPIFFKSGKARLKLALFPLLKRNIQIAEIIAEDITLNLENDTQGRPNWVFETYKAPPEESGPGRAKKEKETGSKETGQETKGERRRITFTAVDRLSLKNIEVTYRDYALSRTIKFHLDELEGKAPSQKPMFLKFEGTLNKYEYAFEINGSPIEDLAAKDRPWAFTLDGNLAGKKIKAKGDMMVRNNQPEINLAFGIKDVNVGAILSALGLVEGLNASVGDAGFKVSINGGSLKQILQQSSMIFAVRDGNWKVTLPNTSATVDISDLSGTIRVEKGNAVTMDLKGKIDQTPVELKITGSPLVQYVTTPKEIPLTIHAKLANTTLDFSSKLALPVTSRNLKLALKITGDRLDDLDDLFKLDLPPIGPIFLDTRLAINKSGYDLSTLKIKVGKSNLSGKMKLDTTPERPLLDIKLVSDLVRIEDFDTKKGGKTESGKAEKKKTDQKSYPEQKTKKAPNKNRRNILSYEVLNKFNADIKIEARQVTSGKDKLGSALIYTKLEDGRLAIDPLHVNVPGGDIDIKFGYYPTPDNATINLKLNIDKFDFGIIARRAKPETDMGGLFSLKAELNSTAPDLKHMMENASGYFDFMLAPENFSAGIIDLWAVNLISAIINKTSEKEKSQINCIVVRLKMKDGVMKERAIYLDTTKLRIAGKAKIDFKNRELDILLVPKAKRPEFFSLATPIKVHGTFDDFGLGIGIARLAGTAISFITSPIHVPIRRIFSKKVAADGYDACMAAWTLTDKDRKVKIQNSQ